MTHQKPTHGELFRLSFTVDGELIQLYFNSNEERERYRALSAEHFGVNISAGIIRNNSKSSRANDKTLPVGLSESIGEKKGDTKYLKTRAGNPIGSISTWLGKKCVKRAYGNKRTRAQAIAEITQIRIEYIHSNGLAKI